jgi:hypothetical protein
MIDLSERTERTEGVYGGRGIIPIETGIRTEYSNFQSPTIPFEATVSRARVDASRYFLALRFHVYPTSSLHGEFKTTAGV